jgi:holo-[acyl-carrier protein] synthase
MNIIGLGLDVTEISRIQYMLERYGDRFRERVFTPGEVAYCQRRRNFAASYAARFAAKEAGMKAIGTGKSHGVLWRDVEVVRVSGPPQLRFHGAAARHFAAMGGKEAFLTLTHTGHQALAQVILVGG